MDFIGFCQMSTTANNYIPVFVMIHNPFLHSFFYCVHLPCRKKFAIGKGFEAIFIATDAYKLFNMAIPWSKVIITNRPINCKAIPCRSFKIIFTPALGLPCPDQRLAAYLVAAYPIKRLLLDVRMLLIFYKKMHGVFPEGI